jgi:hypothetical protein
MIVAVLRNLPVVGPIVAKLEALPIFNRLTSKPEGKTSMV